MVAERRSTLHIRRSAILRHLRATVNLPSKNQELDHLLFLLGVTGTPESALCDPAGFPTFAFSSACLQGAQRLWSLRPSPAERRRSLRGETSLTCLQSLLAQPLWEFPNVSFLEIRKPRERERERERERREVCHYYITITPQPVRQVRSALSMIPEKTTIHICNKNYRKMEKETQLYKALRHLV